MAWLSGIAGKAEELLNRLDENAAVALTSEKSSKKIVVDDNLVEVTSTLGSDIRDLNKKASIKRHSPQHSNGGLDVIQPLVSTPALSTSSSSHSLLEQQSQSVKSSPSHQVNSTTKNSMSNKFNKLEDEDERLIHFLNNKNSSLSSTEENEVGLKELNYNNTNDSLSIDVDVNMKHSSDNVSSRVPVGAAEQQHMTSSLDKENQMLKNEVRTVNNEMSLLIHRTKAAEKESERLREEIQESQRRVSRLQADLQGVRLQLTTNDDRTRHLQVENERLTNNLAAYNESTNHANIEMTTAMEELKQRLLDTQLKESSISTELASLRDRLRVSEEEKLRIDNLRRELDSQNETITARLSDANNEFEQYRTRAQRTLSNKEQLIAELRKSSSESSEDKILDMELQQLREERAALSEEAQRMSSRLELVRGELSSAERKLELAKEETVSIQAALQESLLQEQRRREVAEEDCRAQSEELHSIREELSRQRMQLTARLRERDGELTRLRSQLTQRPASPPQVPAELESRMTALTASLVQKQASVEVLTSEKNALRLQLEKMEYKYREAVKLLNQVQGRTINVNDTDDAKAQVPSFLIESPFDTGVTRRVKRAYSSLDAVGIRTSVFLRRYPLARILIMCYVVVLHLWVFLVLFSYTPTAESSSNQL